MTNSQIPFKRELKEWLKRHGMTREEFAKETGYTKNSINNMLSRGEIAPRAEKVFRDAMRRIDERDEKKRDLSVMDITLSEETYRKIRDAAEALGMSLDDFIEMVINHKKVK